MNLTNIQKSYIAGFLDGDGSIYVRLKPNSSYKYRFQVAPSIVFYQSTKAEKHLIWISKLIGRGYIRHRKDGITEYIIGDVRSIRELIMNILPYLKFKKKSAQLMLDILDHKEKVKTPKDFMKLSELVDKFEEYNYSKKRINKSDKVKSILKEEGLLTP